MKPARIFIDDPASGSWNMGFDEALLKTSSQNGTWALRFYRWQEPTLSLGYFQKYQDRNLHTESRNCHIVRRATGGGAILHDDELTYSLCIPGSDRISKRNETLYLTVQDVIIEALVNQQIQASKAQKLVQNPEPFLCFQRRADGDILIDGIKVCGSAQRRWKNAILQHGSLLLGKSAFAPQLAGIKDLTGITVNVDELIRQIAGSLEDKFQISFEMGPVSAEIDSIAQETQNGKYLAVDWLKRR